MAKKIEKPIEKLEREYIIPLREKIRNVPRYRKTEKAMKTIKEFIARHMKVVDRDLRKVKIDRYLNEILWMRGIKNPVHKIKVKAIKEGDIVRVEAVDYPERLKFKKAREERVEGKAKEVVEKKKKEAAEKEQKPEEKKTEGEKKEDAEKKEEVEGKKAATIEAGKEMEKAAGKKMKHQTSAKIKEPKHVHRMALQK
jgi:large subunit ribosomal protein L31e